MAGAQLDLTTQTSVDEQLQRIRDEISQLSKRRAGLKSLILSSPALTNQLRHGADAGQRERLDALVDAQRHQNEADASRLCTGVAAFDASGSRGRDREHRPPRGRGRVAAAAAAPARRAKHLVGLHFGPFSQRQVREDDQARQHGQGLSRANCVILVPIGDDDDDGNDDETNENEDAVDGELRGQRQRDRQRPARSLAAQRWAVLSHSLPPWVAVEELEARFLPGDLSDGSALPEQDIHGFILSIRKLLVEYSLRHDAVETMRDRAGADQPELKHLSSDAKEVHVGWADGRLAKITLEDDGQIVEALITARDGGAEDKDAGAKLLRSGHVSSMGEAIMSL